MMQKLFKLLLLACLINGFSVTMPVHAQQQERPFELRIVDLIATEGTDGWTNLHIVLAVENVSDQWLPLDWEGEQATVITDEEFEYACSSSLRIGRYYYDTFIPPGFRVQTGVSLNSYGNASNLLIDCDVSTLTTNWTLRVEDQYGWQVVASDLGHYQPEDVQFPAADILAEPYLFEFGVPIEVESGLFTVDNLRWEAGQLKFDYTFQNSNIGDNGWVSMKYYFLDGDGVLLTYNGDPPSIQAGPGQTVDRFFATDIPSQVYPMYLCVIVDEDKYILARVPTPGDASNHTAEITYDPVTVQYSVPAGWGQSDELSVFGEMFGVVYGSTVLYEYEDDVVYPEKREDSWDEIAHMKPKNGIVIEVIVLDPSNFNLLVTNTEASLAEIGISYTPSQGDDRSFFNNWLAAWNNGSGPAVTDIQIDERMGFQGRAAINDTWVHLIQVRLNNGYVLLIQAYYLDEAAFNALAPVWNDFLNSLQISAPGDFSSDAASVPPTTAASGLTDQTQQAGGSTAATVEVCPHSPPTRLVGLTEARVTSGDPNTIRDQIESPRSLGQIPGGATFRILSGPVCGEGTGLTWWYVEYNGISGWTAEGNGGEYWLEPLNN